MVENFSGKWIPENAPIVGADVFTQTVGIHADGDHKGGLYISDLTPERFGRTRGYALGKMSGKASLVKNLDALGITLSPENQKKVLERVVKMGDSKHQITLDDLPFIIADVMESRDYKHIKLNRCSITSNLDEASEAAIEVDLDGEIHSATGEGNGGFDAFIHAMESVITGRGLEMPELVDYEVKIPRGGNTNALTECIITWSTNRHSKIKTRGVHANQVYAAVLATLRMLNLQIHEQSQEHEPDRGVLEG